MYRVFPIAQISTSINEKSFLVTPSNLKPILLILKNCFLTQYKVLSFISGTDYPENSCRFLIAYEILSLKYNSRVRFKTIVNEITPLDSIESVFTGANWWECEIWDMFGVFVMKPYSLTRLLTDYGFCGHPLRKDFPLAGFLENRYNTVKNKVVYENVELAQEHRTMSYLHPWGEVYE